MHLRPQASSDTRAGHSGVRGFLVEPAVAWLGQLMVERGLGPDALSPHLSSSSRAALCRGGPIDGFIESAKVQAVLAALTTVHGGDLTTTCAALAHRTLVSLPMLRAGCGPTAHANPRHRHFPESALLPRMRAWVRLGEWETPTGAVPGEILVLRADAPVSEVVSLWLSALLATQRSQLSHAAGSVRALRHDSTFVRFVRCVDS